MIHRYTEITISKPYNHAYHDMVYNLQTFQTFNLDTIS